MFQSQLLNWQWLTELEMRLYQAFKELLLTSSSYARASAISLLYSFSRQTYGASS